MAKCIVELIEFTDKGLTGESEKIHNIEFEINSNFESEEEQEKMINIKSMYIMKKNGYEMDNIVVSSIFTY